MHNTHSFITELNENLILFLILNLFYLQTSSVQHEEYQQNKSFIINYETIYYINYITFITSFHIQNLVNYYTNTY